MWNRKRHEDESWEAGNGDATLVLAALRHKEGALEMIFSVETWKDPAAWGLFLADLARHVSEAYEQAHGMPAEQTMIELLRVFHAELLHPTDQAHGHLHRNSGPVVQN